MCKWQLVKGSLDPQTGTPSIRGGHACLVPWFQCGPCTSRQGVTGVWCGLPQAVHSWTHTHVYIYVLLKSGCFAITGTIFPTGEHLTTSEQSHYHTVTSMLSIYWSSFGNHSIWEKVLHYRKPREGAMQRCCNVKRLAHVL